ncbi:MAG TPA: SdrD B-like domain-containing protein, partial [Pirellulaceae bacterium]|nr:SdrD B-like domain-containing protein [Pirellulaceae bacterium]
MAVAPIHVGVTYTEEDGGADLHGDLFEVQFEGGAPGTQLTRLVLNTDQNSPGYSVGDMIFDTVKGGYGADEAYPMTIVSQQGIGQVTWQVEDGGQSLVLQFTGFDAGEKFVFSIDVDEIQQIDGPVTDIAHFNEGVDPIASGVEFQESHATATLAAPNYFDATNTASFRNAYDPLFASSQLLVASIGATTGLPADNAGGKRDRTAGVMVGVQQQPKPASICGAVYLDLNQNGLRDAGEAGVGGATIRIVPVDTIAPQNTVTLETADDGTYCGTGLMPGTYKIVEEQPPGLIDGLDTPGTIDGETRGEAVNPGDKIDEILLNGGDEGVDYLFGEIPPSTLRGRVRLTDPSGDCDGTNSRPLAGVQIELRDAVGALVATATTNADGEYEFTNLPPGVYSIIEHTPDGLLDGDDHVGSLGGSITANDAIGQINVLAGSTGEGYDFCEHAPGLIAGFVYHDQNGDGVYTANESPIAGVTVQLRNADGDLVATQTTDADGFYLFEDLPAGVYAVTEEQPAGWLDGLDVRGTVDGVPTGSAHNPGDLLDQIALGWGQYGLDYDFGEQLPASVRGQVHSNPNEDCSDESQSSSLAGVTLELLDAQGQVVATTVTDADGKYAFTNLPPGTYSVRQVQPVDHFTNSQEAGSAGGDDSVDNLIAQIALGSGVAATDYEFCELPPATLSGRVFQDGDTLKTDDGQPPSDLASVRDGVYSSDDLPIADVLLELRDGLTGEPITNVDALPGLYPVGPIRVRTGADGSYEFKGLRGHRSYAVFEVQPDGYFDGIDTPGTTSGIAFNPGAVVPQFVLETLSVSPGQDAIVRIPLRY